VSRVGENITNFLVGVLGASLSLAGLATIVSLFRGGDKFTTEDIYVFRSVVMIALVVAVLAISPFLIFEIAPDQNWLISSSAYVVCSLLLILQGIKQIRSAQIVIIFPAVSFLLGLGTFSVFALNIANIVVWNNAAIFLMGLLWGLIFVSVRLYLFLVQITNHALGSTSNAEVNDK
jgi:hypothetical protein